MPIPAWAVKLIGSVVVALLVIGTVWYILTSRSRAIKDAAVSNATAVTANASKGAAQDALKITVDTQAMHGRIDVVTSENRNAILAAQGAADQIGRDVDRAGLAALCLRDTYRLQPACVGLLDADPQAAARSDAGSPAPR